MIFRVWISWSPWNSIKKNVTIGPFSTDPSPTRIDWPIKTVNGCSLFMGLWPDQWSILGFYALGVQFEKNILHRFLVFYPLNYLSMMDAVWHNIMIVTLHLKYFSNKVISLSVLTVGRIPTTKTWKSMYSWVTPAKCSISKVITSTDDETLAVNWKEYGEACDGRPRK